jgi:hypothetical protein
VEIIGVPLVAVVRTLGPPAVVAVVGAVLVARRRPPRGGLLAAGLGVYVVAAALPLLWLAVQRATGLARGSEAGLVMILLQPAVEAGAWLLALAALVPRRAPAAPSSGAPADGAARVRGGSG